MALGRDVPNISGIWQTVENLTIPSIHCIIDKQTWSSLPLDNRTQRQGGHTRARLQKESVPLLWGSAGNSSGTDYPHGNQKIPSEGISGDCAGVYTMPSSDCLAPHRMALFNSLILNIQSKKRMGCRTSYSIHTQ